MKVLCLIVLLGACCPNFNVFAQQNSNMCFDGTCTLRFESGAVYTGQVKKGKMHGMGVLTFSNGDKYIGQFAMQYREGEGKMLFKCGDEYCGSFLKNKFSGNGTMKYADGIVYKGQWLDNKPHGKGQIVFPNGCQYEGDVKNGNPDGHGIMQYSDKHKYIGEWQKGKKEGNGEEYDENGKITKGIWHNDRLIIKNKVSDFLLKQNNVENETNCNLSFCHNTIGNFTYSDGSKYYGEFKNGLPDGNGKMIYQSGDKYEGDWHYDAPHGEGIMQFTSGRRYSGIWERGKAIKEINILASDPSMHSNPEKSLETKVWALVIGVSRYTNMPSLKYSDDDAYRFYSFLKSPEGGAVPDKQIRILIDEDASRDKIINNMKQLFLQADENDVVVLYFSGHGIDGSFIPIDFDGHNNRLPHADIKRVFEESKAKNKICIADACYSGSLLTSKTANSDQTIHKYYHELENTKGGLAMLMSSKSQEYSLEDQGLRSGIFSHYLINGLKGQADQNLNKIITVKELFDFTFKKVKEYTAGAQSPCISGSFDPLMPIAVVR